MICKNKFDDETKHNRISLNLTRFFYIYFSSNLSINDIIIISQIRFDHPINNKCKSNFVI